MKAFPAVAPPRFQLKPHVLLERIPGMAAALLLLLLAIGAAWPSAAQDMPRIQVFGGYSYTRYDTPSFGFSDTTGLNGYTFSPAYNLIRGFGVAAELSGQYKTGANLRDIAVGPQFLYARGKCCCSDACSSARPARWCRWEARKKIRPESSSGAEAWTTTSLPALPCAHSRWITCTPICSPRHRTISGFRPAWCIAGARSRRRTGRLRLILSAAADAEELKTGEQNFGRDWMRLIKRTGWLGVALALAWLAGCGGSSSDSGTAHPPVATLT